jgi:hypothetical protein
MARPPHAAASVVCAGLALAVCPLLGPRAAHAIPVFARIYDKPCGACHTVFPQLNPEGERFRANGLHGYEPAIEPLRVGPGLEVPGTLPLALGIGIGGDFIKVDVPNAPSPVSKRFNLEFLALLVGAELGPHLAFLGDYAPLVSNPYSGEEITNTRAGLAFLHGHADRWGWLGNARGGLFELPLGSSPRVHRLSVQGYLTYSVDAFSLLGRPPPGGEALSLASSQLGVELSGLRERDGLGVSVGAVAGSNNREDQNGAKDVFVRLSKAFGFHQAGLFVYHSPDILEDGAQRDAALRIGPDARLYFRSLQLMGQVLAGRDDNPSGLHEPLWWIGGFGEVDYRLHPRLMSLLRFELVGMPTFDDRDRGGSARVRRRLWQLTGGFHWLLEENVKLQVEATYNTNHEAVSDFTVRTWSVTLRLATAFWPFTPPGVARWLGREGP